MKILKLLGLLIVAFVTFSCSTQPKIVPYKPGGIAFAVESMVNADVDARGRIEVAIKNLDSGEFHNYSFRLKRGVWVEYVENLVPGRYLIGEFTGVQSAAAEPSTMKHNMEVVVKSGKNTLSPIAVNLRGPYMYWGAFEIEDEGYWEDYVVEQYKEGE